MIKLKSDDITINIIRNDLQSTSERDFELLVNYVEVFYEIYNDIKLQKIA